MKILITGNMGYVGPSVVNQLRASYPDSELVGFDIGYFGNCITSAEVLPECRVDLQYFGDMRQFPEEVLSDVDSIVHLAGISNDPIGNRFEVVTLDINYRASIDIWKKKLDWIFEKGGMAFLITHPDYLNCTKSRCANEEYPTRAL